MYAYHVQARIELGHVQSVFVGIDFGVEDHLAEGGQQVRCKKDTESNSVTLRDKLF